MSAAELLVDEVTDRNTLVPFLMVHGVVQCICGFSPYFQQQQQ